MILEYDEASFWGNFGLFSGAFAVSFGECRCVFVCVCVFFLFVPIFFFVVDVFFLFSFHASTIKDCLCFVFFSL